MASMRHQQTRSSRRSYRISYAELSSSTNSDLEDASPVRKRPRRSLRRRDLHHRESSISSLDAESVHSSADGTEAQTVQVDLTSCRETHQEHTDNNLKEKERRVKTSTYFSGLKRGKVHHKKAAHQVKTFSTTAPSSRIPPWQTLPYQILLQIMQYAAYPFYHGASRDTGTMRWLLNVSELCSTFHEACISALTATPPLFPAGRAHWLVGLLKASARRDEPHHQPAKPQTSLDYRRKVKRLDVEVKQLLVGKHGIDLAELLQHTPLLEDLRLYHNHDRIGTSVIWSLPNFSKLRWQYNDLFEILDKHNIKLKVFEWNGRFLRDDVTLALLVSAHQRPCLRDVEKLNFLNLNVEHADEETDTIISARHHLLHALSSMRNLLSVTFRSCNIVNSSFVAALPLSLASLTIVRCPYLTGDGVQSYFLESGVTLKRIRLLSNQTMDLGFLHDLEMSCPNLADLEIDLNFHDPTSFRDTEPLFDDLLPQGPPTWPSTLQSISIEPLRTLDYKDAEEFYTSLISAAPTLPYLRVLKLKTLLNDISWRDRAQMRTKWQNLFDQVFNINFNSTMAGSRRVESPILPEDQFSNKRKSARISTKGPSVPVRQEIPHLREAGTEDNTGRVERQGRCHTVTFELSDQRPAQDQFREQDFLDDEPDDDMEWTGKDEMAVPKYSARKYGW